MELARICLCVRTDGEALGEVCRLRCQRNNSVKKNGKFFPKNCQSNNFGFFLDISKSWVEMTARSCVMSVIKWLFRLSEEEKINNKNYNLEVDVGMRIFCDVGLISSHLFFYWKTVSQPLFRWLGCFILFHSIKVCLNTLVKGVVVVSTIAV